jgi:hypothetical protein
MKLSVAGSGDPVLYYSPHGFSRVTAKIAKGDKEGLKYESDQETETGRSCVSGGADAPNAVRNRGAVFRRLCFTDPMFAESYGGNQGRQVR